MRMTNDTDRKALLGHFILYDFDDFAYISNCCHLTYMLLLKYKCIRWCQPEEGRGYPLVERVVFCRSPSHPRTSSCVLCESKADATAATMPVGSCPSHMNLPPPSAFGNVRLRVPCSHIMLNIGRSINGIFDGLLSSEWPDSRFWRSRPV